MKIRGRKRSLPDGSMSWFPLLIGSFLVLPCLLWQACWLKRELSYDSATFQSTLLNVEVGHQLSSGRHVSSSRVEVVERPATLLNFELIRSTLLREAPWAESHGANHDTYLGGALLYYAYAYAFQCRTIVVLGSGGGFVPRILKQAQRDLEASGRTGPFNLYLVDAHLPEAGWGSTFYADNMDTIMRQEFNDIHYIFNRTDDGYEILKEQGIEIDYLHVDADHTYTQSWRDFDNYSKLLSKRAVVSFHDTCRDPNRKCHVTGVAQTIDKVRSEMNERGLQLMDAHYLYRGLAFAIRQDAPPLDTPSDRRINFCRNNADNLGKVSPGFSLNGDKGTLPTLGNFFDCHTSYNMTDILDDQPCPFGKRRHPLKGSCRECIPGMIGEDCQKFRYENLRRTVQQKLEYTVQTQYLPQSSFAAELVAGWLATEAFHRQRAKKIFELGPSASKDPSKVSSEQDLVRIFGREELLVASNLIHNVHTMIAVDPLIIRQPLWLDRNYGSNERIDRQIHLPCPMKDVLQDYWALLRLNEVDTFVCLECNDFFLMIHGKKESKRLSTLPPFSEYLRSVFPSLQTIAMGVLADETGEYDNRVMETVRTLLNELEGDGIWSLKSDIEVGSNDLESRKRRIVFLTKQ